MGYYNSYDHWSRRVEHRRRRRMRQIISLIRMGVLIILMITLLVIGGMFAAQVKQSPNLSDKSNMNTFGGSSYSYTIGNSFSD